ncbi:MAG: bifunctional folylpolyglutamate synthase/dihydrofolate synthase [Acidobacteriota bacterium]|nr:MAG: bifunctional folylpolyglutamate synthase/dihydrofolate synthase [Acidobacteriota bacterium]
MRSRERSAWRYLDSLELWLMKPGLERIRAVLEELGRPEKNFLSVLVGGTNGKGSVVAYLDSVLREAGFRVGRYTSPHLVSPRERIALNGRLIAPGAFAGVLLDVRDAAGLARSPTGRRGAEASYFEVLTAAAFLYFARRKVDVAVVEVGMGGDWDATNVLGSPLVSVMTNVELDHTRRLGKTRAVIARTKAGIARAGRPLLAGPMTPSAERSVRKVCARVGARLVSVPRVCTLREGKGGNFSARVLGKNFSGLRLGLTGAHQRENAATALAALALARKRLPWSAAALRRGFARARIRGRLERAAGRPATYLDGAHNPSGARALAAFLATRAERPRVLVVAVGREKNAEAMLRAWKRVAEGIVATEVPGHKFFRARHLARLARRVGLPALTTLAGKPCLYAEPSPLRALRRARLLAGREGLVCVAGSLFLVGEILKPKAFRKSP